MTFDLARPRQHLVIFVHVFSLMATSLSEIKSRCIWPVLSVCYFMVVKRGQHTGTKNAVLTIFTCCLRSIFGLSWRDRAPNTSVLQASGSFDLITIIGHRRLRWAGHVCRMEDNRLPKEVLYRDIPQKTFKMRRRCAHWTHKRS